MGSGSISPRKKLITVNLSCLLLILGSVLIFTSFTEAHTLGAKNVFTNQKVIKILVENSTTESSGVASTPEIENCTEHSIDEFPEDLFTKEQRKRGAILLHVFFGLYCFLLTAYVCNDYLLPSLDCICADLKISPDVAGATFLATASCFPELFVNVVGTFLTESDLGVGTVLGGAVFNTFATPAIGALFAAKGIPLKWNILSRDCLIYILSVGCLVIVMWDGVIQWYESSILLLLFAGYFTLLFVNDTLSRLCRQLFMCNSASNKTGEEVKENGNVKTETVKAESNDMPFGTYKPYFHGELVTAYRNSMKKIKAKQAKSENGALPKTPTYEVYEEPETIFVWPSKQAAPKQFWYLFTWPIKLILFATIPDCRYKRVRKYYPATFLICVIWIAISSYLVSWMTTVVGDTVGIPDSVMGITFLSAGGNLPELVSIITLSRQGQGDMAMSNTLGANTLDILLCLSLPWAIRSFMTGKPILIESGALAYSNLSIILCVIGFYLVTAFYNYVLNKKVGAVCLLMYTLFLIVAILLELNVFFFVNLPMC